MSLYLVTGGAGFIGSHIVERLHQRGEQVRVLDNFSTGRREHLLAARSIEIVEGDVRDTESVRRAMEGVEYVLHQAALVSVPKSMADPSITHAVNVTGLLNVLSAARDADVRRLVLASSCSVYGDNDDLPLKETAATRPRSPYAASKLIGEVYCQTFQRAYNLPTVCLRYFNVYGPRQSPNGDYAAVIAKFAQRLTAGQPPVIYGDGRQTRDFVFVGDVAQANLLACERPEAIGQVLNVASGQSVSLLELVDRLNRLHGQSFAPQFQPARAGDIRHSVGDGQRLAALGFRAETSLAEGLKQMVEISRGPISMIRQ